MARSIPGPGGLWPLRIPVICCGGPPLATGLAVAGALAWGGLGLGLAVLLAGAMLIIRQRRRARAADSVPELTGQVSISCVREARRAAVGILPAGGDARLAVGQLAGGHRLESPAPGGEFHPGRRPVVRVGAALYQPGPSGQADHGGHPLLGQAGPGGELAHPQPVLFEERYQHRPVLRPDLTVALHPERLIEDKAAHLAACQRIGPDWI